MTSLNRKEAPATPPSKPGTSKGEESCSEYSVPTSSIQLTPSHDNPLQDPIVAAIRVLARRGRQLREAREAATVPADNAERETGRKPKEAQQ